MSAPEVLCADPVVGRGENEIVRRAVRGSVALGIRQSGVLGLNLMGSVILARLLTPGEFGVYAVVLFARSFLAAFADGGLGAGLIRQPDEPGAAVCG